MRGFSRNIVNYYPLEYPVESEEKGFYLEYMISTVILYCIVCFKILKMKNKAILDMNGR